MSDHARPIVIRCPTTGGFVTTGIAMDAGSFASCSLSNNTVGPCPHCGGSHTWSKADAFLG